MSTPGPDKSERQARKEYVHDRTRLVIKACLIGLVVALVLGLLGLFDVWGRLFPDVDDTAAGNFGVSAPCAPANAVAIDPSNITVAVLNGTEKSGLADAVSEALDYRGFNIKGIGDATHEYKHTTIVAGVNGLAAAYSLRAQFTGAVLEMSTSIDKVVTVIIGDDFYDLKPADSVTIKDGQKLTSFKGCVAPNDIKNPLKAGTIGTLENDVV